MILIRSLLSLSLLMVFSLTEIRADPPIPSRKHVSDAVVTVVKAEGNSITFKYTVLTSSGQGGGRNRRPSVKAEEKEETMDVVDKVAIKDSKAKESKGSMESLTEGQIIKIGISKETTRPVGEKPSVRLVITKIEIVHPPMRKVKD